MPRLPIPGSDNGTWGDILNEFLLVEHNNDGTQKTLDISKGGTGATDATTARSNLGAISSSDAQALADAKVADAINNGTTTIAPSQNAVFDALALKTDVSSFNDHNARHEPGGADALDFTTVNLSGTLASRPAAASSNSGLLYLATDESGGSTYRSNGSSWVQIAPGVSDAINWRDTWAGGTTYAIGDAVYHGGSAWIAVNAGNGNTPQVGSSQWSLMAQAGTNAQSEIVYASTSANFSSSSTTYVDVTGLSIAPNTTSSIYIEAGGLVQISQGSSAAGTNVNLNVGIVDDQSTFVAVSSFRLPVTGTCINQMFIRGVITPNSTSRTYKVQAKIDVSTSSFIIWGSNSLGILNGFHIGAYTK